MNIVDSVIIIFILVCILGGIRRGFVKETVFLVGLILVFILSFSIKTSVSTFMYRNLPFLGTSGIFAKMSSLNILLYELIAFLLTMSILYAILRILLMISGIIEKILKFTVILGFFSRVAGAILGAIEGYILVFIILFILNLPFINSSFLNGSKYMYPILKKTPILSSYVVDLVNVSDEINEIVKSYKKDNSKDFNEKTIELLLKYDIVSEENIEYLKEKGKI